MTDDPFAPQGEKSDPFKSQEKTETPKESKPVTEVNQTEGKITATLKQHGGFDAAWIVVHGANASEVKETLRDIMNEDLLNAVAITASAFADTKAGNQAPPAPPQRSSNYQNNNRPQGGGNQSRGRGRAKQAPDGALPATVCNHNPAPVEGPYGWFWGCGLDREAPGRCKAEKMKFNN